VNSLPQNKAEKPMRSIDSQALLAGQKLITIQHGQHQYVLRLTKENKLILTK
jgi:hemin uptake protein HemP